MEMDQSFETYALYRIIMTPSIVSHARQHPLLKLSSSDCDVPSGSKLIISYLAKKKKNHQCD